MEAQLLSLLAAFLLKRVLMCKSGAILSKKSYEKGTEIKRSKGEGYTSKWGLRWHADKVRYAGGRAFIAIFAGSRVDFLQVSPSWPFSEGSGLWTSERTTSWHRASSIYFLPVKHQHVKFLYSTPLEKENFSFCMSLLDHLKKDPVSHPSANMHKQEN